MSCWIFRSFFLIAIKRLIKFSLNFNQKLDILLPRYFCRNTADWLSCKSKICSHILFFVYLFVYLFICLLMYLFIYLSIYLFIYLFIYLYFIYKSWPLSFKNIRLIIVQLFYIEIQIRIMTCILKSKNL